MTEVAVILLLVLRAKVVLLGAISVVFAFSLLPEDVTKRGVFQLRYQLKPADFSKDITFFF